ncbi:capsular biosynthesis protein [Shinella yambaruensis]|uniref:Transport permease protein n=1 Tax=Shinella yambaruensis TaxID=415996 RepID=A0ABQ5ZAV4_9HYPH|nr:capsular biosynthesis protein [Shinella yambaruensis]MCJ8029546.1 capsular biosynthesis protein [Shinella yambaruensis]MCU7983734.1 capsular biosynthesis protein [Shinella yambaruensis]GLR48807.1 transport permease protein [Shinella yambaruensis]
MTRSGRPPILDALREKRNVMTAVMLRDMRTRFFNHGLGFLIVSLWPLAHMLILIGVYTLFGRTAPFGDSLRIFFLTGLIPTLTFMYVSRFMCLSLALNRPMLAFPVVKVLDIMAARALLEITAAFLTLFFAFTLLLLLGDNPFPRDPFQAFYGYLALLLLAIGVGSIAGVITMFFSFFATLYGLSMILVYILSGTLFVASALPESLVYPLSFNPVLHAVEWMRVAYYEGYSDRVLDKEYLIGFGVTSLCLGLLMERMLRRIMLEG